MDEFLSLLSSSSPAGWSDLYPSLITSFPAFSLFLNPCFSLSLSIAPSLQSFSYSCFGFPWYLVRQGCNEWHFSLVALGDWDWQPSCLLVSSAGWFKNATRYAHIHSWLVATETPHISYVFVSVSTTVTIVLQVLLALFASFLFLHSQSTFFMLIGKEN